mmetsp:Transcript_15827/g.22715  ORF Transcript_15827/g.22715 Transcript_15827/m.22715 type:complete len:102 (+) Transcript_15827:159-464(+)
MSDYRFFPLPLIMTDGNAFETFVRMVPRLGSDVCEMIEEKLHNRCDCCDQRLYAVWKKWDTALVGVTTWFHHGIAVRECDECHLSSSRYKLHMKLVFDQDV